MSQVPVTLLTGFLGSGKTTLLNRLLRGETGLRIGVLVNDFGAINIDERLVAAIEGDTVSLTNGCVCCTMRGDLASSVRSILDRDEPPQLLVVEASGVADPAGVASAFRGSPLAALTRLDCIVAVVDAENARNPRLDEVLVRAQIRHADIVVLNKIDLVSPRTRADRRSWLRALAPRARILETSQADVPLAVILDTPTASHDHAPNPPAHAGTQFERWTYTSSRPMAYRRLREALETLPSEIYRAKGVFALADAPAMKFVGQVVGSRVELDVLGPWGNESPSSELVCIALGNIDRAALQARFDACATSAVLLMSHENFIAARSNARPLAETAAS